VNNNLHIAFLAAAMLATATQAALGKAPPPPPAPQFLGSDAGTFSLGGTGDKSFYVTLEAGQYVITGDIRTTAASARNFNLTGVTVTSGAFGDSFEQKGADDYFELPYTLTLLAPANLTLAVSTNDKANGGYAGTLTIADVPPAAVVPEPAPAVLLLAGLGLLGIAARRRLR
jgi:hypothetical protein